MTSLPPPSWHWAGVDARPGGCKCVPSPDNTHLGPPLHPKYSPCPTTATTAPLWHPPAGCPQGAGSTHKPPPPRVAWVQVMGPRGCGVGVGGGSPRLCPCPCVHPAASQGSPSQGCHRPWVQPGEGTGWTDTPPPPTSQDAGQSSRSVGHCPTPTGGGTTPPNPIWGHPGGPCPPSTHAASHPMPAAPARPPLPVPREPWVGGPHHCPGWVGGGGTTRARWDPIFPRESAPCRSAGGGGGPSAPVGARCRVPATRCRVARNRPPAPRRC